MRITLRRALVGAAMSLALVGSAFAAPTASAAPAGPTGDAALAQQALNAIEPTNAADAISGIEAANALLNQLGITPFTPTLGLCTDFTISPAIGGAVPGPSTPGLGDLTLPIVDLDLNAVRSGEILYGFVPVGVFNDSGNKSGMQVAWLNVNTFEGGLGAPLGSLTDVIIDAAFERTPGLSAVAGLVRPLLTEALDFIPSNGVRGGIVETGEGTVLSAIYGTVRNGSDTCFFFPSLGIAVAS